jgi:hypothetical protein
LQIASPSLFLAEAETRVVDFDIEPNLAVSQRRLLQTNGYLAHIREFQGVVNEVRQNLFEATGVGDEWNRRSRRQHCQQLDPLPLRFGTEQAYDILKEVGWDEIGFSQFDVTRFDFRQVEKIIQKPEQDLAGALDFFHVVFLLVRQVGP